MTAPPKLYSDDHVEETTGAVLSKVDELVCDLLSKFSEEEKRTFLQIDRCGEWIRERGFKRVALQFPDAYLGLAPFLSAEIERATTAKTFVLADTSYRSCCVDHIAAEHANTDCLIHFGDACLSDPSDKLPVLYIFGNLSVSNDSLRSSLLDQVKSCSDCRDLVVLVDTLFSDSTDQIVAECRRSLPEHNVVACVVSRDAEFQKFGRSVPDVVRSSKEYILFFVGLNESPLSTLWLMTYPSCTGVVHFNPLLQKLETESSMVYSRHLRKRLLLTEKVRDARTVALVIGTLGVKGHRESVDRMRALCKASQKQLYVISVGKLNVAKLANFATDVDVFVLLSCPYGVMLNTADYYRPIVCFFEAENALNPSKDWMCGSGWTPDFSDCLKDEIGELGDDDADVSLVTGRIRTTHVVDDESSKDGSKQVAVYSAGDYFNERTWKGLDGSCDNGQSSLVLEEGRSGIAAEYQNEPGRFFPYKEFKLAANSSFVCIETSNC
ncbi:hypothetical protein QR680_001402 [Steinernema hermaphroditum]|uniref:2-(3-amino-3-carboxypropyl)histidine synthase subunit 2 n=1 Tax=Steinernema hermaphroditum TaxID=289476 RepID=A0AA39GY62_9BILA|nr:hypothetical protein QR680_001402 [Steinernema hermaphroditum]